jgi:16S rRNA (cytidine1402-2'-O)-methyltransferase
MDEKLDRGLYVVATPIGNLADLTPRALNVLKRVDVVACEDTRNTQSLLQHFDVRPRLIAVHEHNERAAADGVVKLIADGNAVALVSDAGTPAVSDPGALVVKAVHRAGFAVTPIVGASAVVAAMSASGEGEGGFAFHGFLPTKSGERQRAAAALRTTLVKMPVVLYESPHRIVESVADIAAVFADAPQQEIIICRELTKKFESVVRLPLGDAVSWLQADANNQRGEFVLVLAKLPSGAADEAKMTENALLERTLQVLLAELPLKQAVSIAVSLTGAKKNLAYDMALTLRDANAGKST